jgi:hypothetical protein
MSALTSHSTSHMLTVIESKGSYQVGCPVSAAEASYYDLKTAPELIGTPSPVLSAVSDSPSAQGELDCAKSDRAGAAVQSTFGGSVKTVIILIMALYLGACAKSGSAGPAAFSDSPAPTPAPIVENLTLKSGNGFTCVSRTRNLWCWGTNGTVGLGSATPVLIAQDDTVIVNVRLRNNTVCWEAAVLQRPHARNAGTATYCIGSASLNGSYSAFSEIVYSGPSYGAANSSSDLTYAITPFIGADLTLDYLFDQTTVMTDPINSVSQSTEACLITSTQIVCASKTITL